MQQIKIADLFTQRVGMLVGRIAAIEMFTTKSKYGEKLPDGTDPVVNVYKLTLQDETGTIGYDDWCKKQGATRIYVVGQLLKFDYAKLKPGKLNTTTNEPYPSTVTTEKGSIIQLLSADGKTPISRTGPTVTQPVQPVAAVALPSVASSPVPQLAVVPQAVGPEYLIVKAQYPKFYSAVDVLFNNVYVLLPEDKKGIVDTAFKNLMDLIWGPQ